MLKDFLMEPQSNDSRRDHNGECCLPHFTSRTKKEMADWPRGMIEDANWSTYMLRLFRGERHYGSQMEDGNGY
jgi:hypothetical protein